VGVGEGVVVVRREGVLWLLACKGL
jgi:hypothetical protein